MFSFAVAIPMTRKLGHGLSVFSLPANDSRLRRQVVFSYLVIFFLFSFFFILYRTTQESFIKHSTRTLDLYGVLFLKGLGNFYFQVVGTHSI